MPTPVPPDHLPRLPHQPHQPHQPHLPRLIMRRATWVAVPVLLAALALGAARMAEDVAQEVDAAASLALVMAELGRLSAPGAATASDDAATLDALLLLQRARPLRHLRLLVQDAQGRLLLPPAPDGDAGWLAAWPRWGAPASQAPQVVQWPVPRPGGTAWTVQLTTSPEAERREALASLLESLALLAAAVAGLLAVMRWNLGRALAPLNRLVASIGGIEAQDHRSVQALPTMPVQELETLAAALRHLGAALDEAEAGRRTLRQQVLTLQEDERARLARELHDEFGQRLTAMRVDATWLGRRLAAMPADGPAAMPPDLAALRPVVAGLAEQCALIQQDIRGLLTRLQPFGRAAGAAAVAGGEDRAGAGSDVGSGDDPAPDRTPIDRLAELLQGLVSAWGAQARAQPLACQLSLTWQARPTDPPGPWPTGPQAPALPQALALALYRITQEALTNAARHAQAQQVQVQLALHGPAVPGGALRLDWSVADDGLGLTLPVDVLAQRGNGLAGLRERLWSQGGDLQVLPARPGQLDRPGLRLSASFQLPG